MASSPGSTFLLIPGAGGEAWYWHRVTPLLTAAGHRVVAVDLPADDDSVGLSGYTDLAIDAVGAVDSPLVIVGQSMGAFTAPLIAARIPTDLIVLVNPMVPRPGESAGQWWATTGQKAAMTAQFERIGLGRNTFDMIEDFFHDVPDDVRAEALATPERQQSDTPFEEPWPLTAWPDVATRVITGRDDRLFPLEFQRRVTRDRLGLEVDTVPGGHLVSLSRPDELAHQMLSYLT